MEHTAVEDVVLGAPSRNTEITVTFKRDHPICKRLAPKELGGGRIIISHYANGVRFNWKDSDLDFQHVEFVGLHSGMTAIQAELYENIVNAAIDIIAPLPPDNPFYGDIFVTPRDFRRLDDNSNITGYGVSHIDGRTSLTVSLKPSSQYRPYFQEDRTRFEVLFDEKSVCFRWIGPDGQANWDVISATATANIAELNSILSHPLAHMEKLLQYGLRAQALERAHDQLISNRRLAAFQAQFKAATDG